MLGNEIVIGLALVVVTTILHAAFMVAGIRAARWRINRYGSYTRELAKAVSVSLFTAWMFLGVVSETLLWALFYLYHPDITALPDFETALYFSMVTFTSVGYGEVVITGPWRLLASMEAANGVIIFGWTTALIFHHVQQVYADN